MRSETFNVNLSLEQESDSKKNKVVIFLSFAFILLIFLVFLVGIFSNQVINGLEYFSSVSNFTNLNFVQKPLRGNFFDTNIRRLTDNVPSYVLYTDFFKLQNSKGNYIEDLKEILTISRDELNSLFTKTKNEERNFKIKKVNLDIISKLTKMNDFDKLPVKIELEHERQYLFPFQLSHIIGYVGQVDPTELKDNLYKSGDIIGKYKLERDLENLLKGVSNIGTLVGSQIRREAGIPGNSIVLNIDIDWQNKLYDLLESEVSRYQAASGAGVVIESDSGKIKTMVSYDGFDPNKLVTGIDAQEYNRLIQKRSLPFLDKAITQVAAPGSTFKILTSYALLESKKITESDIYFSNRCMNLPGGSQFCEFGRFFYGNMNVTRALYKSSNIFFCNYIVNKSGLSDLVETAKLFNIGSKTGVDLSGELEGVLDSPEYRLSLGSQNWFDGDSCNLSIGQGALLVTPLQMAMVASALDNGGTYYTPRLIQKIVDHKGDIVKYFEPEIKKNISFESSLEIINSALRESVVNPEGLVRNLANLPNNVRAKTGTAETFENLNGNLLPRTHGWVVGSFDFSGKSYSFAIHIHNGILGSNATFVLRKMLNCINTNFSPVCSNF